MNANLNGIIKLDSHHFMPICLLLTLYNEYIDCADSATI